MKAISVVLSLATMLLCSTAQPHHTFAIEYERTETITIDAVVTGVYFQNPHVRLDLLASVGDAEPEVWVANSVSPSALVRRGWLRDTINVGDRLTLYGNLGSNGSKRIWIQTLTLESGTEIYPVGRAPEPGDSAGAAESQ